MKKASLPEGSEAFLYSTALALVGRAPRRSVMLTA
jgi:hypothetical protein